VVRKYAIKQVNGKICALNVGSRTRIISEKQTFINNPDTYSIELK